MLLMRRHRYRPRHLIIHRTEKQRELYKTKNKICGICGTTKTKMRYYKEYNKWYPSWRYNDNIIKCERCYDRTNRKPIKHRRQICFLGKRLILSFDIRFGICKICCRKPRVKTHLHHYFYISCMPWACTIEVCPTCHMNGHWDTGELRKS